MCICICICICIGIGIGIRHRAPWHEERVLGPLRLSSALGLVVFSDPPPPPCMRFFAPSGPLTINKSISLPTSHQDRFGAMLGPNLGPSWGQVGTQMGPKTILKPLPPWTCIRCCVCSLLRPSRSRLCEVVGEAGGPFLAYPPMALKVFLNDKVRSSRAPVPCPKGLLRLILGPFWDPC